MRCLIAGLTALFFVSQAQSLPRAPDITSTAAGLNWISAYRHKPEPQYVPAVMRALSKIGVFNEPEQSSAYIGFFAGILGSHPAQAREFIGKALEMRPEDHWFIVRAVAYSGLPNWKELLREFAGRMPDRRVMIEKYVMGELPTLDQLAITPTPSGLERFRDHFKLHKVSDEERRKHSLEPSSEVLDILWGYYFATASYGPIMHIVALLPWSDDHDDTDRLTIGSMAKFTLASNASHDRVLLDMLRSSSHARNQPKKTVAALNEIIDAAETADVARLRKQAVAAVAELQRKGPAYKRDVSWWGYIGQSTIAAGCIAAAVASVTAAGLPCVIGGATASAAVNFWNNQP